MPKIKKIYTMLAVAKLRINLMMNAVSSNSLLLMISRINFQVNSMTYLDGESNSRWISLFSTITQKAH